LKLKRIRLSHSEKAISEVVGAIIMMGIILAAAVVYFSYAVNQTSTQSSTIADILKQARENQEQLISLVYFEYNSDSNQAHLFIYNYGTVDVVLDPTQPALAVAADGSVQKLTGDNMLVPTEFPPHELHEAIFLNPFSTLPSEVVFIPQGGMPFALELSSPGG
jgi:flagellin-like protein